MMVPNETGGNRVTGITFMPSCCAKPQASVLPRYGTVTYGALAKMPTSCLQLEGVNRTGRSLQGVATPDLALKSNLGLIGLESWLGIRAISDHQ